MLFSGQDKLVDSLIKEFGRDKVVSGEYDYGKTFVVTIKGTHKSYRFSDEYDDTPKDAIKYDHFFQFYRTGYDDGDWIETYDPHWGRQRVTPFNWKPYVCDDKIISDIVERFKNG